MEHTSSFGPHRSDFEKVIIFLLNFCNCFNNRIGNDTRQAMGADLHVFGVK